MELNQPYISFPPSWEDHLMFMLVPPTTSFSINLSQNLSPKNYGNNGYVVFLKLLLGFFIHNFVLQL